MTTIAYIADARPSKFGTSGITELTKDLNQIIPQSPTGSVDAVFFVGDFDHISQTLQAINESNIKDIPYFFVVGNHEIDNSVDVPVLRNIYPNSKKLNYSADVNDIHVCVTNQYWDGIDNDAYFKYGGNDGGYISPQLYDFVSNDLSATYYPWKIVLGHEPLFPYRNHVGDSIDRDKVNRDAFQALMVSKGVSVFIGGHTHYAGVTKHDTVYHADCGNCGMQAGGSGKDDFASIIYTHTSDKNLILTWKHENPTWDNPKVMTYTISGSVVPPVPVPVPVPIPPVPSQIPICSFRTEPEDVIVNEPVTFIDTSTSSPTRFDWFFGDGTEIWYTKDAIVKHTYTKTGTYLMRHLASNSTGCSTTYYKNIIVTDAPAPPIPPVPQPSNLPIAGWRSSAYGYQLQSSPAYWVNVAKAISAKFPGTTPGGIWLVGETDGSPATGTLLYMPQTGSYPNIRFQGDDIHEPYLEAFDQAGVKVILQVEPMNADINSLIDIVIGRYKNHPCVIGFGVDIEWYKTCPDGCKPSVEDIVIWNNRLHSYNPEYVLMIKHYDEAKLPTGIPSDVLVVCDDEQNGSLGSLVSEHKRMAGTYPNNPFGSQIGYLSDKTIWGSMSDPALQLGNAIKIALDDRPISIFWVDFSIEDVFLPSDFDIPSIPPEPPVPPVPPVPSPDIDLARIVQQLDSAIDILIATRDELKE